MKIIFRSFSRQGFFSRLEIFIKRMKEIIEIKIQRETPKVRKPRRGFLDHKTERARKSGKRRSGVLKFVLRYFRTSFKLMSEKSASQIKGRESSRYIESVSPSFRLGKKEKKRIAGKE